MTGIAVTVFLAMTVPGSANGQELSGAELKSFVNGKRVYLQVPLGGEFPLHYKKSGTVSGDGTALGLGKFLAPKESGKWWVDANRLCQKWPTWYKGRTTCFKITKTGPATLRWLRDDGTKGKARIGG